MSSSRRLVACLPGLLLAAAALAAPATRPATRPHAAPPPGSAAPHGAEGRASHDATVRHRFDDVAHWEKMFDDPSRDAWQKPEELVKALHLAPGDRVADLGAGTGYFEAHLARAVGERGTVLAVDVEPKLIEHLRARAEREDTANVIPVLGSFDNPRLPAAYLDLVLIVDTYHHIDDRPAYFRRLKGALRDGGRVAVVDFHKRPLPVGPPPEHKLDSAQVKEEMGLAGYRLVEELDLLPHQYVLVFRPAP